MNLRTFGRAAARLAFAAVLLGTPLQGFNATPAEPAAINTLPRVALVIGNGRYADVPLKNAPNDATAINRNVVEAYTGLWDSWWWSNISILGVLPLTHRDNAIACA